MVLFIYTTTIVNNKTLGKRTVSILNTSQTKQNLSLIMQHEKNTQLGKASHLSKYRALTIAFLPKVLEEFPFRTTLRYKTDGRKR